MRATLSLAYLVFQRARFVPNACRQASVWALTPHFHPYLLLADGFFLLHFLSSLWPAFPFGSALLYAVRTFLFVKYEAMNSFAYTKVKLYTKLNVLFSTQFIP